LGRQLAEGGFAFVYAAIDAVTGARYVLKKVLVQVRCPRLDPIMSVGVQTPTHTGPLQDNSMRDLVQREIGLMQRLEHQNIVRYVDSCLISGIMGRKMEALILMEFCSGAWRHTAVIPLSSVALMPSPPSVVPAISLYPKVGASWT
jgi:serine/threonine protein kinase